MKTKRQRRRGGIEKRQVRKSRRRRVSIGGGFMNWDILSVYDFETFEKKCLPDAWFRKFRFSCAHTIELNNVIRFPKRSEYIKHLELLDRFNRAHPNSMKNQKYRQLQFLLAYFLNILDKHNNETEAENELKKLLQVLHPYYYILLVASRKHVKLDESNEFTMGLLHRVSQKEWVRDLIEKKVHDPRAMEKEDDDEEDEDEDKDEEDDEDGEEKESRDGGALWFSHKKIAPEEESDLKMSNILYWVYQVNNELWKLRKPSDLVRVMQRGYTMIGDTDEIPSNIDREITNVKPVENNYRWAHNKVWDMTFTIKQDMSSFYRSSSYDKTYKEFAGEFKRNLKIAIFHEGKIRYVSKVDGVADKNDIFEFMNQLKLVCENHQEKYNLDDKNFYIKRILELRAFSTSALPFNDLFFDSFDLNLNIPMMFGIFSRFWTDGNLSTKGIHTAHMVSLHFKDERLQELVNNFIIKYIPNSVKDTFLDYVKDGNYIQQCYILDDKIIYIAPQTVSLCGFKLFQVVVFSDIFTEHLNDVKYESHCLLLWDKEDHHDLVNFEKVDEYKKDYAGYVNGVLKPVFSDYLIKYRNVMIVN